VEEAGRFKAPWKTLRGRVDQERYQDVLSKLHQQAEDAAAWYDKCVNYFRSCPQPGVPGPRALIPAATTVSDERSQK
jgi:alpha-glucuronidase